MGVRIRARMGRTPQGLGLAGIQLLEDGGGEGAGLPRARLGAAQYVPAPKGGGDGLLLDGGGLLIAQGLQGVENLGAEPQLLKGHKNVPFLSNIPATAT